MAGSVKGEFRVEYRRDHNLYDRNLIFFAINPGKKQNEWRSQNIFGKSQVEKIVSDINSAKAFAAIVQDPSHVFVSKQDIDRLTMWIRPTDSPSGDAAAWLIMQAKDLTVDEAVLINDSLKKTITANLKGGIQGLDGGQNRFVTVTLSEDFVNAK